MRVSAGESAASSCLSSCHLSSTNRSALSSSWKSLQDVPIALLGKKCRICRETVSCWIDSCQHPSPMRKAPRLSAMVCSSTIFESIVRKSSMPHSSPASEPICACSPLLVELLLDDGLSFVLPALLELVSSGLGFEISFRTHAKLEDHRKIKCRSRERHTENCESHTEVVAVHTFGMCQKLTDSGQGRHLLHALRWSLLSIHHLLLPCLKTHHL